MKETTALDETVRTHLARSAELPFSTALAEGGLPIDSYVGLLRAMVIVERAIEQMAGQDASTTSTHEPRSPLIARDLERFSDQELTDTPGALLRAALLAQDLQPPPGNEGRFAAVFQHAICASAIGQSSLHILVDRLHGPAGGQGTRYLAHLAELPTGDWQQLIGDTTEALLFEGVRQMLDGIEEMLQALYPLPSERLRDLVAALNPEAGTHAIPDDLREIQAALRAGETSLRQFPYYHERYGERGRRFTHSDSAWLVTLTELTQPLINQQIDWLGRVLASRGMPRQLLASHLDILGHELALAIPERAHEYAKLHRAAQHVNSHRRALIDDNVLASLQQDFDARVGTEWQQRLPHTGALLGAAVADEADGIKKAVVSVESWFSDPALFPPHWIAAVHATLDEARRIVRARV